MRKFALFLSLLLTVSLLAGCAGTPVVYYSDCTCPADSHAPAATEAAPEVVPSEGALKTGLYIGTNVSGSKAATAEENGEAKYDVTICAVLVDDNGVIQDCIIDNIGTSVTFDAAGAFTSDLYAQIQSKNELGEKYGMKVASSIGKEWNEQIAALAKYAVGKTAEQLRSGAVTEAGMPSADMATSATIKLGGFVSAVEAAVANAQHLGAQAGDSLRLASNASAAKSTPASAEAAGNAQLEVDATALTLKDGVITSCVIDSVQAKVGFDAAGAITSDLSAPVLTKTQLGYDYGMVAYKASTMEWFEQVASFCKYVTGKTPAEVAGIAVTETTAPAEADLAASCTIAVGGFQALIAKAAQ